MEQIEKLKAFITNNYLFGKEDKLSYETNLLEKGIIDSTGILELVCFVEETFNFSVQDDEIIPENFSSLNKLNDYVDRKLSKNSVLVSQCAASQE